MPRIGGNKIDPIKFEALRNRQHRELVHRHEHCDRSVRLVGINTGNADLFFHQSALQNATFEELHEGQSVEFEEGESPKGRCAENVRVV